MLADGLDPMYRAALGTSHTPYFLLEVLDGNQNVLESGLTYQSGNVTATLTSRISRTCTASFAEDMYPFTTHGLLAPYGNMLRAWRGIEFADGTRFAWVIFVGRIQQAQLNNNGTCVVQADDFAADVLERRFVRPENSVATNTVTQEITRLISDGFPAADFGLMEDFTIPVRARTWQLDRGQALDEMATSVGAFWYPLADGQFTLRRYPWTVFTPPVVTYSDTGTYGSVVGSAASRSREDVFNSLTVTGERLNGDPPVFALAQDNNPDNITYVNGTFGVRHQLLRLQTPGTVGAAQGAADDNLRRLISPTDAWSWDMSVDAALELGDTVQLDVRGQTGIIQVVASMNIPFDLSGAMRVTGRSRVAGILEGVQ
jgi:hypothetical protein